MGTDFEETVVNIANTKNVEETDFAFVRRLLVSINLNPKVNWTQLWSNVWVIPHILIVRRQSSDLHWLCICNSQMQPVFTFANQAGLDMLETTLVALQDITLDKIFDEAGQKQLHSGLVKLMEQVLVTLLNILQAIRCILYPEFLVQFCRAFRVICIFLLVCAAQGWVVMFRLSRRSHGKFCAKITMHIVLIYAL